MKNAIAAVLYIALMFYIVFSLIIGGGYIISAIFSIPLWVGVCAEVVFLILLCCTIFSVASRNALEK